ncbi:MAG: DNA cytosine methyltransferase [Halothiobacillaceae bacterium]|nr:DNA cytosine methyltransferase [Halothiobacillaceae bacterium]
MNLQTMHNNATAPEHIMTHGASVDDLRQIAKAFRSRIDGGEFADVTRIFESPTAEQVVRLQNKVKVHVQGRGWMSPAEARAEIARWKANAANQGQSNANADKVVLSFFDLSGEWSKPWEEAGYQVFRFDIQADPDMGDINKFSCEFFNEWFGDFDGMEIYAILAACPCTDFAVSGARHFAAKDADGRTVSSVQLVSQTLAAIEYFKPVIWALENPVGRIAELTGLPEWRLSFDPNHLGDTYTKKTLIWGRFNADLPIAPVEPTEGSKMHMKYGGKSIATKNARSVTPEGFAYAFFQANNALDNPALAVMNRYDRLDDALICDAIAAGVKPEEIDSAVEDYFYMDLDDEAANDAIFSLLTAHGGKRNLHGQGVLFN